jgi:hypothetical protein
MRQYLIAKGVEKGASDEKKDSSSGSEQRRSTSSGKKVATWASLFQDEDEKLALEGSELGQYSCTKLLKEMEVLEAEDDEEEYVMRMEDDELVSLPERWLPNNHGIASLNLPKEIMVIPEMSEIPKSQSDGKQDGVWLRRFRKEISQDGGQS